MDFIPIIDYRWIEQGQLAILQPILEKFGMKDLNHATSRALCAFDGENLVGFHILQLFPHCEPMWVDKAYRGTGMPDELAKRMMEFMQSVQARGFMVVADNPASEKLCKAYGMRKIESPVYVL